MKYCLRNLLGEDQRKALFLFCDMCSKLLSECHNKADIQILINEINVTLAILERDLPVTIQVSCKNLSLCSYVAM